MMATDRTRQRLATLLAQAEEFRKRGADGEADAALARAEDIMIKYSLGYSDVEDLTTAPESAKNEVRKVVFTFTGIYKQAELAVVSRIVNAFGTARTIMANGYTERNVDELWVITHDSEHERFDVLIASIRIQLHSALATWWKENKIFFTSSTAMEKFKAKREFMLAFGQGAAQRITRAREALLRQYPNTGALVRASSTEVDRFMQQFNTRNVKQRMQPGAASARHAGYAAGLSTNTGDTGVRSGRREIGA